jgi:hypothetical protein
MRQQSAHLGQVAFQGVLVNARGLRRHGVPADSRKHRFPLGDQVPQPAVGPLHIAEPVLDCRSHVADLLVYLLKPLTRQRGGFATLRFPLAAEFSVDLGNELPPLPEALLAFCRTQASIQKLVVEAYRQRSRNLLLQALLIDPVVNSVENVEKMLDYMLELQKDYLPAFT